MLLHKCYLPKWSVSPWETRKDRRWEGRSVTCEQGCPWSTGHFSFGAGRRVNTQEPPHQLPCLHPTELEDLSPSAALEPAEGQRGGERGWAITLRGGQAAICQPSAGRRGLWGQGVAALHQEIQGHRSLPTSLNSGPSHPKLPNPTFVICEATYFLLFLEAGCVRNLQPLSACVTPTPPHPTPTVV